MSHSDRDALAIYYDAQAIRTSLLEAIEDENDPLLEQLRQLSDRQLEIAAEEVILCADATWERYEKDARMIVDRAMQMAQEKAIGSPNAD